MTLIKYFDYTPGVMNRFKGLDLIDRVPQELWTEVGNTVQEMVIKINQRKRNSGRPSGRSEGAHV